MGAMRAMLVASTILVGCGRFGFEGVTNVAEPDAAPGDSVQGAACTVAACPVAEGFAVVDAGCYRLSTGGGGESWLEAEQACELVGAHLVVIDDVAEHFTIHTISAGIPKVWLGWTDRRLEGAFEWIAPNPGGPTVGSSCFFPAGEPTAGDGDHCVAVQGTNSCGDHADFNCDLDLPYVCECDGRLADPSTF